MPTSFDLDINIHKTIVSRSSEKKKKYNLYAASNSSCQFSLKSCYAIFGVLYKHFRFAVLWLGLKCLLLSITFRLIGLNKKEGMGGKTVCHFLFLTHHWSDGSLCPDCDGKVLQLLLPNAERKSGTGIALEHLHLCMQNGDGEREQ